MHCAQAQTRSIAKPVLSADKRLALVLSNSTYANEKNLPNAHNDAQDMATTLGALGFEVILKENLTRNQMEDAISNFTDRLKNYSVGLFYFAGHGFMGTQKDNYLMGIDMQLKSSESFARERSVSIEGVIGSMEEAKNTPTKIVIIDACRNNPFRSWGRSDQKGLGTITAPDGLIAFFAASATEESSENTGERNGLFTQELLKQLKRPNLTFDELIRNTSSAVKKQNSAQHPYRAGDLSDIFYFNPKGIPPPPPKDPDLPPFMDMVRIQGGSFDMGSNEGDADEKPVHAVTVRSFSMGRYEVTVGQFAQFVAETNYQTDAEKSGSSRFYDGDKNAIRDSTGINWRYGANMARLSARDYNHPVVHVSHNDAVAFCEWLSGKEGKTYRLPTEAEWEYAAGNGSKHSKYSWGNTDPTKAVANVGDESFQGTFKIFTWTKFANYNDGYTYTAPVGSFVANELGLYDMAGNVWELCSDWFKGYPGSSAVSDYTASHRVFRGGSWFDAPQLSRVAYRGYSVPSYRCDRLGFRLVYLQ